MMSRIIGVATKGPSQFLHLARANLQLAGIFKLKPKRPTAQSRIRPQSVCQPQKVIDSLLTRPFIHLQVRHASNFTSNKLKLISETFIKRKHNEFADEASKSPYYLGAMDLAILSLGHMQPSLVFHFKPKSIPSFLENLKRSLSISLIHFYPLGGQLATEKYPHEHASWIYVDCNKGPGARLLHASVDLTVSDIILTSATTDVHPMARSFLDLGEKAVNHDGHTRPLVSIQVTELLDGMILGFTVNHAVADGTSLFHFISSLSHIFLQLESNQNEEAIFIRKRPIYKPFLPQGFGPLLKLPYLEPEEFVSRFEPGPLRERIFHFSSAAMEKLKAKAQKGEAHCGVSSFQALSALLWKCVTKARNLEPMEKTDCRVVVNIRPKIDPPFPETCFGNLFDGVSASCNVGELLGHELGWAAKLVHRAIMAHDNKRIRGFMESYVKAPFVAQPGTESAGCKPNSVMLVGSSRFDMYGPEFGLGRAVDVLMGYANKDDGWMMATPGREGGRSVNLEVCLKPYVMDALELDGEFMSFVS